MSIIDKNQPNWFGNNGEPLKSGYIYIGQPNQTPVEFPKTVTFTDSSGSSFTATQPLRTNSDGQIVWNGKAIIATVDGDYSMLVLNSTQTQINGGYVPFVEGDASSVITLTNYREYGLLLADIKQLDVAPAQTVGNIGKTTATDTLGADWLVVSNTGGGADDIDLIDFDNGLQGERIRNYVSEVDGVVLRSLQNLADVDDIDISRTTLNAQKNEAAVANYTKANTSYNITDLAASPTITPTALSANGVFETYGPTGSGALNIWTVLDSLPAGFTYIDVYIRTSASVGAAAQMLLKTHTRSSGSAASANDFTEIARAAGDSTNVSDSAHARISVNGSGVFELAWAATGAATTNLTIVSLRGFGF